MVEETCSLPIASYTYPYTCASSSDSPVLTTSGKFWKVSCAVFLLD